MTTTPQRYTKKPVTVEAIQWDGAAEGATPIINWILANSGTARFHEERPPRLHSDHCRCDGLGIVPNPAGPPALPCPETEPKGPATPAAIAIDTLEGTMKCLPGSFVIKGIAGEFYACDPDIFHDSYEQSVKDLSFPTGTGQDTAGEREILVTDSGQLIEGVHPQDTCFGPCPIHSPTDHPLQAAASFWSNSRRLWMRICSHGSIHPDPDSLAWKNLTENEDDGPARVRRLLRRSTVVGSNLSR